MQLRWVLVCISLVAVPSVPSAASEPRGDCEGVATNTPFIKVEGRADCTFDVYVNHDMACLWNTTSHTEDYGVVRVTSYWCSEPTSSGCIGAVVPLLVEGSRLELGADCTATLYVTPGIMCLGGSVGHWARTIGPLTVDYTYCKNPNGDPT